MSGLLPDPALTRVYRLEATLGEPLNLGDLAQGRRRIVPLTGGTSGPRYVRSRTRARSPTASRESRGSSCNVET